MKWTRSNGKILETRDCSTVIVRLEAGAAAPLPILDEIEDDDRARERLRRLIATGLYRRVKLNERI